LPSPHPQLRQGPTRMLKWRLEIFSLLGGCIVLTFCYNIHLWSYCNLLQTSLTNPMFLLSHRHVLNRSCALAAHRLGAFHVSASVSSLPIPPALSSLENKSDTVGAREWLNVFRNATVTRDLVELSFARSSGPGGQVRASLLVRRNVSDLRYLPLMLHRTSTRSIRKRQCDVKLMRNGFLCGLGRNCANQWVVCCIELFLY
jgi:hypothetical protein